MTYRVLIIDDSALFRGVLTEVLGSDSRVKVVGAASNGEMGLSKLADLKPDAVVLDVEMPVMNGIETLRAIRAKHTKLPVIMFSTLTDRGAKTTLEALSLGASDYATKPHSSSGVRDSSTVIHWKCSISSAASMAKDMARFLGA